MADDNPVLEHLRHIRGQLDAVQDTLAEHGQRLTGMEHGLADIRRTLSHDAETAANQSTRIDRLVERIGRLERRLELADD